MNAWEAYADSFDGIIGYEVGRVKEGFEEFMRASI